MMVVAGVWCERFAPTLLLLLLPTTAAEREVGLHGLDLDDDDEYRDGARTEKALPSWKAYEATQRLVRKDFMVDRSTKDTINEK